MFQDIGATLQGTSRPLRIVSFHGDQGKAIHVVTNLIVVDPEGIADLYRARWQVELFFRWLKQHLNATTLFGTTENAVNGQLFGACITYVLLHMLYNWKKPGHFRSVSMLDFMRDLWNLQHHL
ncbi:transposase [Kroppenstedtia sanguinis]|uniref:Transposase n=1 Tax=Kroppenstedtia sanguinis TaxID=1380684 RepID=A0ABW4C6A9_9BACL